MTRLDVLEDSMRDRMDEPVLEATGDGVENLGELLDKLELAAERGRAWGESCECYTEGSLGVIAIVRVELETAREEEKPEPEER